jgi:hypothetical protein
LQQCCPVSVTVTPAAKTGLLFFCYARKSEITCSSKLIGWTCCWTGGKQRLRHSSSPSVIWQPRTWTLWFRFYWRGIFPHGATAPSGPEPPHYRGFTVILRHIALCRTPLDEWSAVRRDLYLSTHNTHKRQTSVPPAKFEPAIPASERPQTHALDRAATGMDSTAIITSNYT